MSGSVLCVVSSTDGKSASIWCGVVSDNTVVFFSTEGLYSVLVWYGE